MIDPLANNLFDLPEYEETEDETFPPLPPPSSPRRDDVERALASEGAEPDGNKSSQTKDSAVSTQKTTKRPIPKLDAQRYRLISERGLPALRHVFDNAKFKGKGHEVQTEDLKTLLRHMEHWAHRLFPKLQFDDFIERVELLGNKKEVQVQTCLKRIRLDLPILHEDFTNNEGTGSGGGNNRLGMSPEEELDPFSENVKEELDSQSGTTLTEEQQRRIEKNRQLALERRQAKMQFNSQSQENGIDQSTSQPNEEKFKTTVAQDPADLTVEIHTAEAKVVMEAVDKDTQLKCAEEIK
uniref:TIMELESS-interacting protein n=1 Tax=Pelodiscus sinensis TaxID=13735 RepID=K7FY02_PELSI